MSATHHRHTAGLPLGHRQFLHGYYVLPCCSGQHCGFQAPSNPTRHTKQPFSIDSILSSTATPRPSKSTPSWSVDYNYLRTKPTTTGTTLSSLPPLQRLQPYPHYSSPLSASLESKGECAPVKRPWKAEKPKRVRTIFSPDQLERLEKEFDSQQYIVGTERFYLASELELTETQVKVWFQNRRIKWRKQNLEMPKSKDDGDEEET